MREASKAVVILALLLISNSAIAVPETIASVRTRAHEEIVQRDATIAALQQKVAAQQKQIDAMHETFMEAMQKVKALRASLVAAGILPSDSDNSHQLNVTYPVTNAPARTQPLNSASSDSGSYVFVPPPHPVPAFLMKYEKLVDKYVKLHPNTIPSVKETNGHIEWVEVNDAQPFATDRYYVDAYVFVTYPADPVQNEMQIPNSRERARFDVNLDTGEISYAGIF